MIDTWDLALSQFPDYGLRLGVAILCGSLLGIERERKDKPAGLRTIVLITVGSALFMIVSNLLPLITGGPASITRVDPGRIAAGVVSGVGFLGAGSIIQARGSVRGLTTAAVIWVAAGIGLCAGLGLPVLALFTTLVSLATLILMEPLRTWLTRLGRRTSIEFIAPNDSLILKRVEHVLEEHGVRQDETTIHHLSDDEVSVEASYHAGGGTPGHLLDALGRIEGVRGAPFAS